jgi:hypothetical protein
MRSTVPHDVSWSVMISFSIGLFVLGLILGVLWL